MKMLNKKFGVTILALFMICAMVISNVPKKVFALEGSEPAVVKIAEVDSKLKTEEEVSTVPPVEGTTTPEIIEEVVTPTVGEETKVNEVATPAPAASLRAVAAVAEQQGFTIFIGNVDVAVGEYWKVGSAGYPVAATAADYNIRWDNINHKLYLKDLVTSTRRASSTWMKSIILIDALESEPRKNLEVVVEGTNVLDALGGRDGSGYIAFACYLKGGALTFSGTGSLKAKDRWTGFYTDGSLIFRDSGNYEFVSDGGTDVGMSSRGLNVLDTTNVYSEGAKYGIYTSDVTVAENAALTCKGSIAAFLGSKSVDTFVAAQPDYHNGIEFVPGVMEQFTTTSEYNTETVFFTIKQAAAGTVSGWGRLKNFSTGSHTHAYGDWTIEVEPTATTGGSQKRRCLLCPAAEVEMLPKTGGNPGGDGLAITNKVGFDHKINNGKDLTLEFAGAVDDLAYIYIDGKSIRGTDFFSLSPISPDSSLLTLKASYLDTLAVGKHTIVLEFRDKSTTTVEFNITGSGPKTGDTSNTGLLFSIMALSACIAVVCLKRKKSLA